LRGSTPYRSQFAQVGEQGSLLVGGRLVAAVDALGEVLGQVADAPGRLRATGQDSLRVELDAEPGDVDRFGLLVQVVERLFPGGQGFAGVGIDEPGLALVPMWEPVDVHRLIARGPPHLVVGRGGDLA
jgi:hypothetical protein